MKIFSFLLCIVTLISFTQCRSGRTLSKAISTRDTTKLVQIKTEKDSIELINTTKAIFKTNTIDYKTFSAKIKVEIETTKGREPDLMANVRVIKDSAIWISISATIFNYEVVRALITKDSVILVDKQKKEVHYRSIGYLQELTDIPFDLKTIQNLLVGNPIFFDEKSMTVKKFETYLLVSTLYNEYKNLTTISTPSNLMRHCKLDDINVAQNRTADFTYDNYTSADGIVFSTHREIIASEKNKLVVNMNYKQYEFNKELSVSFNVPKSYKKN
jgi:Domain of unknown function (DUF4292)